MQLNMGQTMKLRRLILSNPTEVKSIESRVNTKDHVEFKFMVDYMCYCWDKI